MIVDALIALYLMIFGEDWTGPLILFGIILGVGAAGKAILDELTGKAARDQIQRYREGGNNG